MRSSFYSEYFEDMLPKIHRFIRIRFPSDLAADLAAETLLTLWRKQLPVPADEIALRKLRTLTYKIALGHISNEERRIARERSHLGQMPLKVQTGPDPTFEAVVPVLLAEAIASLDPNDQQAVNLLIAGFKTSEIADILDITPKAASMRLARARQRLDTKLVHREEGLHDKRA